MDVDEEENVHNPVEKIDKEQLIRGFKYGTTYAPCPDGQFPKLPTKKGIDFEGFFKAKNVSTRHHLFIRLRFNFMPL